MQDKMRECRKLMQEVARNKNSVEEDRKTAQRNNIFFDSYQVFKTSLDSFLVVKNVFGFSPSPRTIQSMQRVMRETQEVFKNTTVSNPARYRDNVKECCDLITSEWERFIAADVNKLREDLQIVRLVAKQRAQLNDILHRLELCRNWPVSDENAAKTKNAKKEAQKLLTEMHFDEHISMFLRKVQSNSATLLDLTPPVKEWIEKEGLAERIVLRIQM